MVSLRPRAHRAHWISIYANAAHAWIVSAWNHFDTADYIRPSIRVPHFSYGAANVRGPLVSSQ